MVESPSAPRTNKGVLCSRLPIPELELNPSSWIGFSGHLNRASVQLAGNLAGLALGLRYQKGCSNYRVERSPFIVKDQTAAPPLNSLWLRWRAQKQRASQPPSLTKDLPKACNCWWSKIILRRYECSRPCCVNKATRFSPRKAFRPRSSLSSPSVSTDYSA